LSPAWWLVFICCSAPQTSRVRSCQFLEGSSLHVRGARRNDDVIIAVVAADAVIDGCREISKTSAGFSAD
jgi:hypothetical protein